MRVGDASDSFYCYATAVEFDLPNIHYRRNIPGDHGEKEEIVRRPHDDECQLFSFPQTWGSTALGFDGIGGSAMTTAQTTVVICDVSNKAAVYFGRRLAYICEVGESLMVDIHAHTVADQFKARELYSAVAAAE